jgi:hypothetical protein
MVAAKIAITINIIPSFLILFLSLQILFSQYDFMLFYPRSKRIRAIKKTTEVVLFV